MFLLAQKTLVLEAVMQVGSMLVLLAAGDKNQCCHSGTQYAHVLHNTFGPSPLSYTAMYAISK
jgi:hypothetical protein